MKDVPTRPATGFREVSHAVLREPRRWHPTALRRLRSRHRAGHRVRQQRLLRHGDVGVPDAAARRGGLPVRRLRPTRPRPVRRRVERVRPRHSGRRRRRAAAPPRPVRGDTGRALHRDRGSRTLSDPARRRAGGEGGTRRGHGARRRPVRGPSGGHRPGRRRGRQRGLPPRPGRLSSDGRRSSPSTFPGTNSPRPMCSP